MIRCILIILAVIFCISCKESKPSGIIKPEKMKEILWDVFKADALSQQIVSTDSSKSLAEENVRLTRQVFLIHKVTKEEFEKSYTYYTQHPAIMISMLDSINAQQARISTSEASIRKRWLHDSTKKLIK